jgi:hypothetical protein
MELIIVSIIVVAAFIHVGRFLFKSESNCNTNCNQGRNCNCGGK